jgi:hypothetical protein
VLSGARMQNIVQLCNQEVNSLTKDDIVILWGGSNDVAQNETLNALRHLKKFVSRKKCIKFIVITVPHRYDLMDSSCVNEEIKVFNRKLHKFMKAENNVKILDIKLDRSYYIRHGNHLNINGKEKAREMMINQIKTCTTTKDIGDIIVLNRVNKLDEYTQVDVTDNVSSKVEELQLNDEKKEKGKKEDK